MVANGEDSKVTAENGSSAPTNEKKKLVVAVGSRNPVKVNAVKRALETVLERSSLELDLEVKGLDVPSEVAAQPFGDVSCRRRRTRGDRNRWLRIFRVLLSFQEETQLGAKNRAEGAYRKYKETNGTYPHLAVGLEGGLELSSTIQDANGEGTLWCMAWMAIYGKRTTLLAECMASANAKFYAADRKPICCLSKTGTFLLPSSLARLVLDGMELGHADDKVFGRVNSKQKSGTVGILTDGIINRTEYYEHALILALIPWIRPDVYAAPSKQPAHQESTGESSTASTGSTSTSLIGSLFCSSRKS